MARQVRRKDEERTMKKNEIIVIDITNLDDCKKIIDLFKKK